MIVVAFLVPLAVYLLGLSWINRRPRPVVVAGTWDFIGLLFAASGFLLFVGPAVLSSLNERWRRLWVLGEVGELPAGLAPYRAAGLLLGAVYFALVVAGAAWGLLRRRRLTCVYNVEPADVERGLEETCRQLGLEPVRSGDLLVFGLVGAAGPPGETSPGPGRAILELESSVALKHVTLCWEPHDSPLRAAVEAELRRRLARTEAPYHEVAGWLNLAGSLLLMAAGFVVALLVVRAMLPR